MAAGSSSASLVPLAGPTAVAVVAVLPDTFRLRRLVDRARERRELVESRRKPPAVARRGRGGLGGGCGGSADEPGTTRCCDRIEARDIERRLLVLSGLFGRVCASDMVLLLVDGVASA